jgi:hypothetical protein
LLAAAVRELAAEDLDRLADTALVEDILTLRRLLNGLDGQWLRRVAAADARGAAGADQAEQALSTAAWLRHRLRMAAGAAHSNLRTARALFRGPLTETAQALVDGQISPAHATVIVDGTQDLPEHVKLDADPVLAELAGGWIRRGCARPPPICARWSILTVRTAKPSAAMGGGGCGCRKPSTAWWASMGCWNPKPDHPAGGAEAAGPPGRWPGPSQRWAAER